MYLESPPHAAARRAAPRGAVLAGARDPRAHAAPRRDLVRGRPARAGAVRRRRHARRVRRRARATTSAGRTLQYSTTEGDPALRAAVAARLTARGLPTHADELLITSGSQQALTLIATVLLEPGDTVLVEEPSYLAALQAFQLAGATVVPVPCDDDGLDPDAAAALAERHGARLLYTIPTFQNPTGRTLPTERREALVAHARRAGFWLLEDDPYGELRYRGEPLPPLAALDDRVLSLSTLSKIAAPGLRIGWVRAPEPLRRPLTIAKQAADLHSSTVDQAAAARWLEAIDLDDAGRAAARAPTARAATRCSPGWPSALPAGSTHNHPDGGMFVWARLPDGWDAAALLERALDHDVAFVPGFPFFAGPPDPATLRLSFTAHGPDEIAEGLRRLRRAWRPKGLPSSGGAERVEVAPQRDPDRLVDRQREPQGEREPRRAAPARAGEPLRQAGQAQNATSWAQWRRTRDGHGSSCADSRASSSTVRCGSRIADEPAGGRRAHRGRDPGAAEQLDAERGDDAAGGRGAGAAGGRGAAAAGRRPARPRSPARAPAPSPTPVRAVGRGELGRAEQPARLVVEPRPRLRRVDRPELGGEREQQLVGAGARAVGELGEGGGSVHSGLNPDRRGRA